MIFQYALYFKSYLNLKFPTDRLMNFLKLEIIITKYNIQNILKLSSLGNLPSKCQSYSVFR